MARFSTSRGGSSTRVAKRTPAAGRCGASRCQSESGRPVAAGEKLFVDYAGSTVPIIDADTGEILYASDADARVAPASLTKLFTACVSVLKEWTQRLREQLGEGFPDKVTAFHPEMAVHGRFREPCPVCGTKVQRIRYAKNEVNYCPTCQTSGKLLADRSLSLLLKKDWD